MLSESPASLLLRCVQLVLSVVLLLCCVCYRCSYVWCCLQRLGVIVWPLELQTKGMVRCFDVFA